MCALKPPRELLRKSIMQCHAIPLTGSAKDLKNKRGGSSKDLSRKERHPTRIRFKIHTRSGF